MFMHLLVHVTRMVKKEEVMILGPREFRLNMGRGGGSGGRGKTM